MQAFLQDFSPLSPPRMAYGWVHRGSVCVCWQWAGPLASRHPSAHLGSLRSPPAPADLWDGCQLLSLCLLLLSQISRPKHSAPLSPMPSLLEIGLLSSNTSPAQAHRREPQELPLTHTSCGTPGVLSQPGVCLLHCSAIPSSVRGVSSPNSKQQIGKSPPFLDSLTTYTYHLVCLSQPR